LDPLLGAIEAGGTKFVCAVGQPPDRILAEEQFPTTQPRETFDRALDFFRRHEADGGPVSALGIAAFGPLDLDPRSPSFGQITSTPKPGWAFTDVRSVFREALHVPVAIDTDVNAAALAEGRWGAAQGLDTFVYLTIGTGIGGGGFINGAPIRGMLHPEMGHIWIPHDRTIDPFDGTCAFHRDCLEGLASGPAIESRWHAPPPSLPSDHAAWSLEAHYLALAITTFICTLSPQRVILGGGVMRQTVLFPRIRTEVIDLLNGYVQAAPILEAVDAYIVPPALGEHAGILGALALAAGAAP
jgi:fructokinase